MWSCSASGDSAYNATPRGSARRCTRHHVVCELGATYVCRPGVAELFLPLYSALIFAWSALWATDRPLRRGNTYSELRMSVSCSEFTLQRVRLKQPEGRNSERGLHPFAISYNPFSLHY